MDESNPRDPGESSPLKVEDKRRFAHLEEEVEGDAAERPEATGEGPAAELGAARARAEAAERRLYEFAAAFDEFKSEQGRIRARLERDVATKVESRFGALVADLLEAVDDLDRALEHARSIPAAEPIVRGLSIARERFVSMLLKNGVARLDLEGTEFDPNSAEAVALEPVADPALLGKVVSVVRPGYTLGDRVLRPARVTVGRAAN